MGTNNKLSRLAAGLLSVSLALGAAGTASAAGKPATEAPVDYSAYTEELYDYDVNEISVLSVDKEDEYIVLTAAPLINGAVNYFNRLTFHFEPPFTTTDGHTFNIDSDSWERTLALIDKLEPDMIISFRASSKFEYNDDGTGDGLNKSFAARGSYTLNRLYDLRSDSLSYYGDINCDGCVDTFDVPIYRAVIAGTNKTALTDTQFLNGDINKNGEIDESDLEQVVDFVLGKADRFSNVCEMRSIRLDDTVSIASENGKATDKSFAAAEMNFGVELLKNCFEPTKTGEENLLISPLSISTALAMTANGADTVTLAEMEKLLGSGLTLDEINEYMAYYVSNLPDSDKEKLLVANSIWFRDDPTFNVREEFLNTNRKFYNAEIYKTVFDDTTVTDINGWVNRNTHSMIPSLLEKGALDSDGNTDVMMLLINTLFFEAEWQERYTSSRDGIFTDLNGTKRTIQRLDSKEEYYYDLGDADAFRKPYLNGNFSFIGILPRDNDIVKYVQGLDAAKLAEGLSKPADAEDIDLYVMIPKFKYSYSKSLSEILPKMGMASAFSDATADFSRIEDLGIPGASELYISDVIHKTRIELTEKGTKAAAATAVVMSKNSSMPMPKKEIRIELDRPFVYMIVDKNNVPVFIGVATQLSEE